MILPAASIESFLDVPDPSFQWVADTLHEELITSSTVPALSDTIMKLWATVEDEGATMEDIERMIVMDPGLTTRCLQVASHSTFSYGPISNMHQALMRLGVREIRNIAITVEVMNSLSRLRLGVDWRDYWSHSLLSARLTDKLFSTFAKPCGMEYLAGLIHDVGKLVIARCFPQQHEQIAEGIEAGDGTELEIERLALGIDHARIGAALAIQLNLNPCIAQAICFHHDPKHPENVDEGCGDNGLLGACVALAAVISDAVHMDEDTAKAIVPEDLPEWQWFEDFDQKGNVSLDLETELKNVDSDLKKLLPALTATWSKRCWRAHYLHVPHLKVCRP